MKSKIRNQKSTIFFGGVAQMGERLPCTQEAIGSNPFTSTTLSLTASVSSTHLLQSKVER